MSCISAILAHRSAVSPLNRAYRQILPTDRLSGGAECQADRRRDESCSFNRAYRQILPSDRWSGGAECQADRRRDESCSLNRAYRQILPTDRLSGGAECQADRQRSGALCQSDPQIGGTAERRRRPGACVPYLHTPGRERDYPRLSLYMRTVPIPECTARRRRRGPLRTGTRG
jgi:hypothetical protein